MVFHYFARLKKDRLISFLRKYLAIVLGAMVPFGAAGQEIVDIGFFTGFTAPYTWDSGIQKDARYRNRYDVKFSPIGFHLGVDKQGYGFTLDPNFFKTGQYYHVINTSGGQAGTRKIDMSYLQVPIGLKFHMIDLSFFKISFITSLSFAYQFGAEETISHEFSKLRFPQAVYPIVPDDYIIEYDGVLVPDVPSYTMSEKSDFRSFQVYGAMGFRSDWDFSEHWRSSLDFRINYGLFDPRTKDYRNRIENNQTLYDLPGTRRDLFASLSIGFSRYIELDRHRQKNDEAWIPGKVKKAPTKTYRDQGWTGNGASTRAKGTKPHKSPSVRKRR